MGINPPIRGSIVIMKFNFRNVSVYQSPYKGFNSLQMVNAILLTKYQSPYKGFNRNCHIAIKKLMFCINPPIRGSIAAGRSRQRKIKLGINPPIRGSIVNNLLKIIHQLMYQSPYKGFNRTR